MRWSLYRFLVVPPLVVVWLLAPATAGPPEVVSSTRRDPIKVTREAIVSAETSVAAVVYKCDEPSLLKALKGAVERGVSVRLLSDAGKSRDKQSLVRAAAKAGVDVRVWPAKRGKMHAKFVLLDGREALAGSYNWTDSAARENLEIVIRFDDSETVKQFAELFEGLWDGGRKLSK